MKLIRLVAVLALFVGAGACERGCAPSPVPAHETVHVRGTAGPGIRLVKMSNRFGLEDRTASVAADGRYDFAWTGHDLTGTFGERSFELIAPAEYNPLEPRVTSSSFVVRADMEMPHLALWQTPLAAWSTADGGLVIRFQGAQGAGFQGIERYEAVLDHDVEETYEDQGRKTTRIVRRSSTMPVTPGETMLSGPEVARLLEGRVTPGVEITVKAIGRGSPVNLTYHPGRSARVDLPVRRP